MATPTGVSESFTTSTMASEGMLTEAPSPKRPGLSSAKGSSRRLFGFGNLLDRISSRKLVDGWQCEYCTYKNKNVEFLSCEICGMIRRAPSLTAEDDLEVLETQIDPQTQPSPPSATPATTVKEKNESTGEEDPRLASASAEQELALRNSKTERENEERLALIEMRMQEIVDRQRQLYDEIAEHRVRRSSIKFHLETQKSISELQDMLQPQPHEESEEPELATTEEENEEEEEKAEIEPIQPVEPMFTPKTPERKIVPVASRKDIIKKQASRRQMRKAQQYDNPVNTMSHNPWEEKSVGLNDLLETQSELWDRVNADRAKPPPQRRTLLSFDQSQQQQPSDRPRFLKHGKKAR